MGNSSWSNATYSSMRSSYSTKSTDQIFTSRKLDNLMSPIGVTFREARDSDNHPTSLATMLFLDVTGSMGIIPEHLIRHKLGALMNTMIAHGIEHPALFFGAIGDHHCDSTPLQVGQFESGTTELDQWLTKIFLEGGGGGQIMESYLLAWLFAARHTSIDCFEKRGQKGFLFTVGDEATHPSVSAADQMRILGYAEANPITAEQLLAEAQRTYHVFHIHVNQGSYKNHPTVFREWKALLKENFIVCEDYDTLAEIVASTVAMLHGVDLKTIASSFDDKTGKAVTKALSGISTDIAKQNDGILTL